MGPPFSVCARSILPRVAANRLGRPSTTLSTILWFHLMVEFEGVHPLEGGAFRLKFRRDRRHGLPRENPLIFYPRYLGEIARKAWGYWSVYRRFKRILNDCLESSDRWTYSDLAIAPHCEEELDTLDLFTATRGGSAAVVKKRSADFARESMRISVRLIEAKAGSKLGGTQTTY